MQLKPFEAGRYDEESVVLRNPANGKQELFSEREYQVVKFLKENQKQSLLALLIPNIGIAKKNHVDMCLRVLGKLKRMQIVDYFAITGRPTESNTETLDLSPRKADTLELSALHPFAATLCGLGAKALAPLRPGGLLGLLVVLAALAYGLFPFGAIDHSLRDHTPNYALLFFVAWLAGSVSFTLRTIVQAAFLAASGRQARDPSLVIYFPVLALTSDRRDANLLGFRARAQMDVIGLLAPFAAAAFFTALALSHLGSPLLCYAGLGACVASALVLACPLFPFDGADLLQAIVGREELEEGVSAKLRKILEFRGPVRRELGLALASFAVWILIWFDSLYSFFEVLAPRIALDMAGGFGLAQVGAMLTTAALMGLLVLPFLVLAISRLRARAQKAKRRIKVAKNQLKDLLTFEQRISALEKIPLFTFLNDQERLTLLNEMQPQFYEDGTYLVHQGEVGKEFYVLVKGQATAQFTAVSGKSQSLATLVEGDAFGEIALIDDVPRTASIVSDGGCVALVLRKDGFDRFSQTLGSPDRVKALIRLTSFFRRHPLFSKLNPRDQAMLIDHFRFHTVTTGEAVGEENESFHVIYSGSVRVDTGGADGETTLGSDDCFGYSNPLNARFVALEGTGLLTVAKPEFHSLIWEKLVAKPELFV